MAVYLRPGSVVPPLRPDLNVTSPPTGTGAEVIDIHPLGSGEHTALHGFELSIALMLDGKRTADEVIGASARLGLPLSLEALEGFVRQLEAHRLLGSGDFPVRRVRPGWPPQVRELFRGALKAAREGDLEGARQRLDRLLGIAPANAEARRLRAWLESHPADGFQALLHEVQETWVRPNRWRWLERAWARVARSPWAPWATVAAAALLAFAALVPLPRITAASARVRPIAQVSVVAPAEGVVGSVAVRPGDRVQAGDVLFSWSTEDLQLALLSASEALDEARLPLRERAARIPEAAGLLARLKRAEAAVARAQAALLRDQMEAAGGEPDPGPAGAEGAFGLAWFELHQATAALDALASPGTVESLRLGALAQEIRSLRERLENRAVRAETGGVVTGLAIKEGDLVLEGQVLMQLDDRDQLWVAAVATPRQVQSFEPGEEVKLWFEDLPVKATVEAVTGHEVIATLDNPEPQVEVGTQQVHLEQEPLTLLQLLLR